MNHAQERALERYALELTGRDLKTLAREIIVERGLKLAANGAKEEHAIECKGKVIRVIFNPKSARIVTILPPSNIPRAKKARLDRRYIRRRRRRKQ